MFSLLFFLFLLLVESCYFKPVPEYSPLLCKAVVFVFPVHNIFNVKVQTSRGALRITHKHDVNVQTSGCSIVVADFVYWGRVQCSRGRAGRGWGHQMLPWLYSHYHLSCYLCC
ncbi:hypothetical protein BVRB_5g103860 [Beta vulgaris subsp. vulgaris]|nr:hypothetical protein BVRB_5g103860 [Beta vulgaris subsp. vulgaris]